MAEPKNKTLGTMQPHLMQLSVKYIQQAFVFFTYSWAWHGPILNYVVSQRHTFLISNTTFLCHLRDHPNHAQSGLFV